MSGQRMVTVGLFAAYTVGSAAALILLRASLPQARVQVAAGRLADGPVLAAAGGALLYAVSFVLWLVILSRVPAAPAYATAVSLTLAATAFLGWMVLEESLSAPQLVGFVLIASGVVLVASGGTP